MASNSKDLVSVVIPCFEPPPYLFDAIESVRKQSYPAIEIVLVNDGTRSPEALSTLREASGRADKYIIQENLGLAAARNSGFRAANGKYVVPLDCDDLIEPTFVAECVEALEARPDAAFAYCDCVVFGTANYIQRLKDYNLYQLLDRNTLVYASLIRRREWELAGGYDEKMRLGYEDWEFWLRLGAGGCVGAHLPKPLFRYRKHGRSLLDIARENHQTLVEYIQEQHPELYSYEGRSGIKRQWSPSVHIAGDVDCSQQTLADCTSGANTVAAPARLIPGDRALDRNSGELAALAVWAGAGWVRLHDGSVAQSWNRSGAAIQSAVGTHVGRTLQRHLQNAGLLSWNAWLRHPLRSATRLIPLRLKENINRACRAEVFDLSFYLQFRPRSIKLAAAIVDPLDYIPRLGPKIRVALITPHLGPGGAETVLYQIATSLDRTQYELSLIATDSRDDRWRSRWETAADYVYDLGSAMASERLAGALYSMARNWRYQFILMQNTLRAYSAASLLREALPSARIMDLIHSIDNDWDIIAATAQVSGAFDVRIAVSEKGAAHLGKAGSPDRKIKVIRSGIDLERFSAADESERSLPHRLLFAGRLDPVKRPQLLVEIMAELTRIRPQRDFRLLVAGDGPEGGRLRKKAESAGLSSLIDFLGHVEDPAPIIRSADVLLLTSCNEGIPLVVLEAMASGKPVVSSNAGAIAEAVLDGNTGVLIEIGPAEARRFASAIHQLLEMPTRRREMGNHARSYVESRYDLEDARASYRELFPAAAERV